MELKTRNVGTGFAELVRLFADFGCYQSLGGRPVPMVSRRTRNGPVVALDEPVTVTFERPTERVLLNAARDANVFALLYESLWMLAGRNDVAPLAYYTKRFAAYSDDGRTLNDAYGYRWRRSGFLETEPSTSNHGRHEPGDWVPVPTGTDQVDALVAHLKAAPDSRRAVLQMWDVPNDLLKIDAGKAVCCNLCVKFRLREASRGEIEEHAHNGYLLDATVFNRSNDLVWGLTAANYVTFTVLLEYVAARLGVGVGRYNVVSDDLHAYQGDGGVTARWEPERWLADRTPDPYAAGCKTVPLVRDPEAFDRELPSFVEAHGGEKWRESDDACVVRSSDYTEPFLRDVASPMLAAFRAYRLAKKFPGSPAGYHAYSSVCAASVKADDWRAAATGWLERRAKK